MGRVRRTSRLEYEFDNKGSTWNVEGYFVFFVGAGNIFFRSFIPKVKNSSLEICRLGNFSPGHSSPGMVGVNFMIVASGD